MAAQTCRDMRLHHFSRFVIVWVVRYVWPQVFAETCACIFACLVLSVSGLYGRVGRRDLQRQLASLACFCRCKGCRAGLAVETCRDMRLHHLFVSAVVRVDIQGHALASLHGVCRCSDWQRLGFASLFWFCCCSGCVVGLATRTCRYMRLHHFVRVVAGCRDMQRHALA